LGGPRGAPLLKCAWGPLGAPKSWCPHSVRGKYLGLLKCLHDGVSWAERIAISLALYVTLRGYAMLPPTRVWRKTGFALARRSERTVSPKVTHWTPS
jgi:hypothetical protein